MVSDTELNKFNNNIKSPIWLQIVIYLLFGLGPLTGNVILVLFGVLSSEFGVSPTAIAIAIPSFMFPFAIVQLFSGAISDIKGRIPIILFGLIIFGVGMFIATFSASLIMYILANILGGVGFGFVNPVLIALMSDISNRADIPKKMGFLGAVANLGVGFGPILAGQLAIISWRWLYIIFILIIILGFFILLGLSKINKSKRRDKHFKIFFGHLISELKRPVVILLILSAFLATQSYLAVITWTSQALTGAIPENVAGMIIGLAGIFGAISGIIIGVMIKKTGISIALAIGIISLFASIFTLLSIEDISNLETLSFVSLGFIFIGIAGGTIIPAVMFYSQTLSYERRGALAGLATASQFVGIALVPITYEFFYYQGGISLVYLAILIVSMVFIIVILVLYFKAKKKK
ncbi:MAG: MFS transporter [Candidatus Lokiarchaeota archaeon]|nr:MFS transporter [Candidatus Lokiarchaeota archaeon]